MIYLKAVAIVAASLAICLDVAAWAKWRITRRNTAISTARQYRADRTKGLPLAFGVENRTADDCPSVALAEHGGGYACELDEGHPLPHRNDVWVWDVGDDVVIDLGAVRDLAAAVNRTADDLMDVADAVADRCRCRCRNHNTNCLPPVSPCCDLCSEVKHPFHAGAGGNECVLTTHGPINDVTPFRRHLIVDEVHIHRDADLAAALGVEPTPTLREQSLPVAEVDTLAAKYVSRELVTYGFSLVHAGCLAARRDHATDHICAGCGLTMARAS